MNDTLVAVGIEGLAVGLFTLIAGASDDVGKLVILFMVGLWMIYLVSNSGAITKLANIPYALTGQNMSQVAI